MKTADAVAHFGTKAAIARALGITPQALTQWGEHPPELAQFKLELLTNGALKRTESPRVSKVDAEIHC